MIKQDPNTGAFQISGSKPDDSNMRSIGLRELAQMEADPELHELFNKIDLDNLNRGFLPLMHRRILNNSKDESVINQEKELEAVEHLRKKRLWQEKVTGVITEDEYQKQLHKDVLV